MCKFKYSTRRLKKLWIRVYENNIEVLIEIDPTINKGLINWINDRSSGHDNFKESLGVAEDKQLIESALEYAKTLKQYNEIKEKYN
jgi:hypothetical protein